VLQKKPHEPASLSRVPAAELEAVVLTALRTHLNTAGAGQQLPDNDRGLVERHVERVTLAQNEIRLRLREISSIQLRALAIAIRRASRRPGLNGVL
jgi:hypothetical protein